MPFRVISLHHVQITVPRTAEAASVRFYRELLGLPELVRPAAQEQQGGTWFQLPGFQIQLKAEDMAGAGPETSGRHVCLAVDDLAACRRAMSRAGIEMLPDERPIPGVQRFFVRDPGGNRLEIMQGG